MAIPSKNPPVSSNRVGQTYGERRGVSQNIDGRLRRFDVPSPAKKTDTFLVSRPKGPAFKPNAEYTKSAKPPHKQVEDGIKKPTHITDEMRITYLNKLLKVLP